MSWKFVGASLIWWTGVCTPLLLSLSKFSGGEYVCAVVSSALAVAMVPYGLCYFDFATSCRGER